MGARPSTYRKGGGYLHEVDAVWSDYQFTVGGETIAKHGPNKGNPFTPLSLEVAFQVDDSAEEATKRLLIGDAEDFGDISEDGKTLSTPEGQTFHRTSEAGIFISSLCEKGFPETAFAETNEEINFEPALGTRLRLIQEVNVEKTKRRGKEKGKDGREYDRKDLKVAEVYSQSPTGARAVQNKTGVVKAEAVKATAKKESKASTPPSKNGEDVEFADETLLALLAENNGRLPKSRLSLKVLTRLMKDERREPTRKLIFSDEYLRRGNGWTYDEAKQIITLDPR